LTESELPGLQHHKGAAFHDLDPGLFGFLSQREILRAASL
jgi:hypothetical protein